MDFNLSEEQRMLRDGAQRWVREQYPFEAHRTIAASDAGFSAAHWHTFAELGWLALGLPEEVGGLGCSFIETSLLAEEFGRGLVLEPYVTTAVLGGRLIEQAPTFTQRIELLSQLAEGTMQLALAHSESDSRFDLHAVHNTVALRAGDGYLIDGEKMMVFSGASADRLIVSAKLQHEEGYALFVVDPHTPGVTRNAYALLDNSRACDVAMRQVAVPAQALLAGPHEAPVLLEEALDRSTLALVAEALGAMEAVMSITSEYLKTRVQFGQPIGKFQALQHRMAEMFAEAQSTRSILFRAIAQLDGPVVARREAVSAAKAMAGRAGRFVGGQGIQLHGGYGMTEEYAIGHYFRRLTVLEKMFGDTDYHLDRFISNRKDH